MAYQIIYLKVLFIQFKIIDFINNITVEDIDLATREGQLRYITIFGKKKFNNMLNYYSIKNITKVSETQCTIDKITISTLYHNLNERTRRLVAAFFVLCMNIKNKNFNINLFDLDSKTIRKGIKELKNGSVLRKNGIRREGGGRKSLYQLYPKFTEQMHLLISDHIAGDPMTKRKWIRKSLSYFKEQFKMLGITISRTSIRKYFKAINISLKVNSKSIYTQQHKDRDNQFKQINRIKKSFLSSGNPVISVDTKKKELIGQFKNPGKGWKKDPVKVYDHDFKNLSKGKAVPFGIYDLTRNKGEIYIGTDYDTPQFAVEMIVNWWMNTGQFDYHNKKNLLILCDAGGPNSYRKHGWKIELQNKLSSAFDLKVTVCHYPPGTSKWNPIEHRLFSYISINWSGVPLDSYETMVSLIDSTTTKNNLKIRSYLVGNKYIKGIEYTEDQKRQLSITKFLTLPDWNYTLHP